MLKPEEINGKMYQPKEIPSGLSGCNECALYSLPNCKGINCEPEERDDKLNVNYTNIEGE